MPTIYSAGNVTTPSYKNPAKNAAIEYDSMGNIISIPAEMINESSSRRFINDEERFALANVKDQMLKADYDSDGDGIVDRAKEAESAETAEKADVADTLTAIQDGSARLVTQDQVDNWDAKQDQLEFTPENVENKGAANGYAPLNENGKIPSEYLDNNNESIEWDNISNKPASSATDIDNAVGKAHTHSNKVALNRIGQSDDGKPTWDSESWPYKGNMERATYDADNDGVVDVAKKADSADSVEWNNISNKPESSVSDIDDSVSKKHSHENIEALNSIGAEDNHLTYNNNKIALQSELPEIGAQNSIEINSNTNKLQLVNDRPNPGANMYYGTNSQGVLGFWLLPSAISPGTVETPPPITEEEDF